MANEQRHRLAQIYQSEQWGLLKFVRSKLPRDDSEDVVQEVYVQALQSLNVLEAVDNLTGWLYTVARNKIIDGYRHKKLPTVSLDAPDANGSKLSDILAADIPEAWDDETRQLVFDAILNRVEELPKAQKFVFIEQVINGRTFRELAEQTGDSINTLLARKRYAVQSLRTRLEEIKNYVNEL